MSDLAQFARAAYADGWSRTIAPLTERVKAGCAVAVSLAVEHADQPDILEATLELGSLEGTWAAVCARREKLYAHHIAAVSVAYRKLITGLDFTDVICRLRRTAGLTEAAPVADLQRHANLAAVASAEATRILHQVATVPSAQTYRDTVTAIADALTDASAEGTAGAIAITAEQAGHVGVDFDLAFDDARAALRHFGDQWGSANRWLGKILNGNAADLGRVLAKALDDGEDFAGMRAAALAVLDGPDIRAVDTVIDLAMGQSFSTGATTLYGREGIMQTDFLSAGGNRVCAQCLDAESGNPWTLSAAPRPPLHPHCMCVLAPASDSILSLSSNLARYLTGE